MCLVSPLASVTLKMILILFVVVVVVFINTHKRTERSKITQFTLNLKVLKRENIFISKDLQIQNKNIHPPGKHDFVVVGNKEPDYTHSR